MAHPKTATWERKLTAILKKVDQELEDAYGQKYPLHPSRLDRGGAANPQYDGLFAVTAAFSAGYGSQHGPGYVIQARMVTLSKVPREFRRTIQDEAAELIRKQLPAAFPGKELEVSREGSIYKIHGDLGLDDA